MTATETRARTTKPAEQLRVDREGIRFHNLTREQVRISIEVRNHGRVRSRPTRMRVEAAPFGAFLAWTPIQTLLVPPLDPGATTFVETTLQQARRGPLTGSDRGIPRWVRTLTGSDDDGMRPMNQLGRLGPRLALILGQARSVQRNAAEQGLLPPDLLELAEGPRPHWMGNLNIWLGSRAVERHFAPRLRVRAGRPNVAMFALGGQDQYALHVDGHGLDWNTSIIDYSAGRRVETQSYPGADGPWHVCVDQGVLFLVLRPAAGTQRGKLDVCVTQRSSGRHAYVEFDLDSSAQGPGCLTI